MADVKAEEYIVPDSPELASPYTKPEYETEQSGEDHNWKEQTVLNTLKEEGSLQNIEDMKSVNPKSITHVKFEMVKQERNSTQSETFPVIANVHSRSSSQHKPEWLKGTEGTPAVEPRIKRHHSSDQYQCTTCDESFTSSLKLKDHMKQHYGQPTHKCPLCGIRFVRVNTLHEHMRLHSPPSVQLSEQHTNTEQVPATEVTDLPHRCHDCNTQFRGKFDLVAHLDRMHSKPIKECSVCGKVLPTTLRLVKHMRIMHSDFRPYTCRKCGAKFAHKDTWRRHEMKQCENAPGNTGTNFTFGSSHLRAICKVCDEEFTSMADLDTHMITMHPGKHCFDCRKIGGQLVLEGSVELANENTEELMENNEEDEDDEEEEEEYNDNLDPDSNFHLKDSDQHKPVPMCIYKNQGNSKAPVPLVMWSTSSPSEDDSSILCDDGAEDLILP